MDEADFDLFEAEYADELAAMEELGQDFSPVCRPRKSLDFATPSVKSKNLDESIFEPLSDDGDNNNVAAADKAEDVTEENPDQEGSSRKRKSTDKVAPVAKRQKAGTDDWDVTPPTPKRGEAPTVDEMNERIMKDYDYERPRVLHRIPAGDFVSVTTDEGRRFYLGVQTEAQRIMKSLDKFDSSLAMNLLGTPYAELKEEVLNKRRTDLVEATEETIQALNPTENEVEQAPESLWVDRYTPSGYMDLLSDESTNRTLLHWLKLWDHVVFGRELKKKDKPRKEKEKFVKKDYRKEQLEAEMELDSLKRPFHKVVLLCGPPGLGKTTLAHVLATHAGYRVTEINASDDRSAETFKNKIDAAIQMKAVMGSDPRPNCLVIDEIDGAPQPAINQLLALVKTTPDTEVDKKKKKAAPLMRPIICICNDQYAPSLRQLKANALLLNFPPTIPVKLTSRLIDICQREGLKAGQSTLLALCNKTDNDIRACINALQFFRGKKHDLLMRDVQTASFAQKDLHKGLFAVWQAIFQRPRQNKRSYVNPYDRTTLSIQEMNRLHNEQNNTSTASRFYTIHNLASTTGEYEKVINGLFDNFLNQSFKDPRLDGICLAMTWLCHADILNSRIHRTQDYSCFSYIPYVMVVFHLLFAVGQVNKLQYPHSDNDCRQKLSMARSLVTSLMEEMSSSVRHYLNVKSVVLDLLPPLMDIIQPSFRPINTQLYSAREKAELKQLISIMVEYNLTYRQDKAPDGHYTYVLDPQVDQLCKFPGLKQRKQMTYAAKQLVAREVDLEKMRRAESSVAPLNPKPVEVRKNVVPNHEKKLQPKPVDEKDLVSKDFFGRKIDSMPQTSVRTTRKESHDDGSALLSRDVWYHFKEGYSNAVRKTVRIQDLM